MTDPVDGGALAPTDVTYAHVVYRLLAAQGDGSDPDSKPDFVALPTGTKITISYPVRKIIDAGATPPVTFYTRDIECYQDEATGNLIDSQNNQGVWIINPNNPNIQPNGWTIHVRIEVPGAAADEFDATLSLQNPDGSYDLTLNSPVPSSLGEFVIIGPKGDTGATGATGPTPSDQQLIPLVLALGGGPIIQGAPGELMPFVHLGDVTGAVDLSWLAGPTVVTMRLVGNVTITLPSLTAYLGKSWLIDLMIQQDGTGGRTVSWASPPLWKGQGVGYSPSIAANALDEVIFELGYRPSDTTYKWCGVVAGQAIS